MSSGVEKSLCVFHNDFKNKNSLTRVYKSRLTNTSNTNNEVNSGLCEWSPLTGSSQENLTFKVKIFELYNLLNSSRSVSYTLKRNSPDGSEPKEDERRSEQSGSKEGTGQEKELDHSNSIGYLPTL